MIDPAHRRHPRRALPGRRRPADTSNAANDAANRPLLDAGFETLLLRLGFLFQVMSQLSLTADDGLDQLLACWAPIGTVGPNSLYQAMFLTPTLLQQDPGAQTATVASTVNVGDVLHTAINGQRPARCPPTPCSPGDTAATAADGHRRRHQRGDGRRPGVRPAARTAGSTPTSDGGVVTIKAGFTLACSRLGQGPARPTRPPPASPLSQTATVAGTGDRRATR